jgi:hypothetical protein
MIRVAEVEEAMKALRTDTISFFDIDFEKSSLDARDMRELARNASSDHYADGLYRESYDWVFYGEALPGCHRLFFDTPSDGIANARGATLLVRPPNGAGVFSLWQTFGPDDDPMHVRNTSYDMFDEFMEYIDDKIGLPIKGIERLYPFIAIRADTEDVATYCDDNAEELGKVFTSYLEQDERDYLIECMKSNLSRRRYERLFVRWTDVLAVYNRNVDQAQQEKTMLRAGQVYEICILVKRLFKNLSDEADALSSALRLPVPRPWGTDRILRSFLEIERRFVMSPPAQSVEAARMLAGA